MIGRGHTLLLKECDHNSLQRYRSTKQLEKRMIKNKSVLPLPHNKKSDDSERFCQQDYRCVSLFYARLFAFPVL